MRAIAIGERERERLKKDLLSRFHGQMNERKQMKVVVVVVVHVNRANLFLQGWNGRQRASTRSARSAKCTIVAVTGSTELGGGPRII